MRLYLVRHGIADPRGDPRDDASRALTPAGVTKTRRAMAGLRAIGCRPELILSSRLVRAWQTAKIAQEKLGAGIPLTREKLLEPSGKVEEFVASLEGMQVESVMAVGHLPGVAEIASLLLCGASDSDLVFKKAATACLSFERPAPSTAALEWLLQPRELGALASEQE
jgi:phosphohistidine phosphatase